MKKHIKRLMAIFFCFGFCLSLISCTPLEGDKKTQPQISTGNETETEAETGAETEAEAESVIQTETENETGTETGTETVTETESESVIQTETETETEVTTEAEKETETETTTEIESETEAGTDMETESTTETVTESETEAETAPKPVLPSEGPIKIYIDQGHNPGTFNQGAEGNGLKEEELPYEIGVLLAGLFEGDDRYEIRLSRPEADTVLGTDNESSLAARVAGAEEFGAHFVISLHINAFTSETANGIEVLVYDEKASGYEMGTYLLEGLLNATSLRNRGMKIRPDLHILRNSKVPTALVEMGFITNPDEAALLDSQPELFAKGVYDGIMTYVASLCEAEATDQTNNNN